MGTKKSLLLPALAVLAVLSGLARTRVALPTVVEPRALPPPSALGPGGGGGGAGGVGAPPPAGDLLRESRRTLPNDATVRLSPYVARPWLRYHDGEGGGATPPPPKRRLVLTDLGWNHRYLNGLSFPRSLRSRELLQAFVDHEHFDPTFRWSREMSKGENATFPPGVHHVVLLDVETCGEMNYPHSAAAFEPNADRQGGRDIEMTPSNSCFLGDRGCREATLASVLTSPLFLRNPNSTSLLFLECGCVGIMSGHPVLSHPGLRVFTYSSTATALRELAPHATGAPLPAGRLVTLSRAQREAVRTCDESDRPYLYTFRGSMRGRARKGLRDVAHNGDDVVVIPSGEMDKSNETYADLMSRAKFSGAPRGDCRFSYRFTEVLSAGAIPVIHSDDWVLPLDGLIDWERCAVRIDEAEVGRTAEILRGIGPEERCARRRYCYDAYQRYLVNPEANVAGMVDSVERARGLR